MPFSPRTLIFIALFNLAVGTGLVAGWAAHSWDRAFYDGLKLGIDKGNHVEIECRGFNEHGQLEYIPYNYGPAPEIPLVTLHSAASEARFGYPQPEPMDWALLLYHLGGHNVKNLYISSPLAWENKSNELVKKTLEDGMAKFRRAVIGKTITLSPRETPMPEEWQSICLQHNQYAGDIAKLVPGNKLYGFPDNLFPNAISAPSQVENDDLYKPLEEDAELSKPLFIRWGDHVIPTAILVSAVESLGLDIADIHVHFGEKLRLGGHASLPIDQIGRIKLREEASPLVLAPGDVIIRQDNPALLHKQSAIFEKLAKAPLTIIDEPAVHMDNVDPGAIHEARAISSILAGIAPGPAIFLQPLSNTLMWVFLIDIVIISLWALRYQKTARCLILGGVLILIAASIIYFYAHEGTWLPWVSFLSAWLFVSIAAPFIRPAQPRPDDDTQDDDGKTTEEDPPITVESFQYKEPNEIPIPGRPKKNSAAGK